MRVLLACERSGRARDAFLARGHEAWSCDLEHSDLPGPHVRGDVKLLLAAPWDLVIAFPPCTHLATSGARWWPMKQADGRQQAAVDFFLAFTKLDCAWAIENPVGLMSRRFRKPDQTIQPWQFGEPFTKTTHLWLNKLPPLVPTRIVSRGEYVVQGGRRIQAWYSNGSGATRRARRDTTFQGIATAMAEQWG